MYNIYLFIVEMEMDNNKCLLLEFVNEDEKIAVGYQEWLQDKITGKEEYLDIIKKKSEVKVKWPNCDIAPASIMKKRVRICEWKTVVAKILSFGGMYMYICVLHFCYNLQILWCIFYRKINYYLYISILRMDQNVPATRQFGNI